MRKAGEATEESQISTSILFSTNEKVLKHKLLIYYNDTKEQSVILTNEGKVHFLVDIKSVKGRYG
jgi:hypothetical protein